MSIRCTGAVAVLAIAIGGTVSAEATCSTIHAMQDFVRPAMPAVEEISTGRSPEELIEMPTAQRLDELAIRAIDDRGRLARLRTVPITRSTSAIRAHSVISAPYGRMFETIALDIRTDRATYDLRLEGFIDISDDTMTR
jgi:hypothetical protein